MVATKACAVLVRIHQRRLEDCWRALGLKRFPDLAFRYGQDYTTGYFSPDDHQIMLNLLPPLSVAVYRSLCPATSLQHSIVATLAHETQHVWQKEQFGKSYLVRMKRKYRHYCEVVWALTVAYIGLLASIISHQYIFGVALTVITFFLGWSSAVDISLLLYRYFGYDHDVVEREAKAFERQALGRADWLSVVSVEVYPLNHLTKSHLKVEVSDY